MSNQIFKLLRAHDSAFRSGDRALHSAARADLKWRIKEGKVDYGRKKETSPITIQGRCGRDYRTSLTTGAVI